MRDPSITSSSDRASSQALSRAGSQIRKHNLIGSMDRVLCMVSGGADSVAMLHLLTLLSQGSDPSVPSGFSLGICHVNYGRRGPDSDADESFVRALGDRLGIPVHAIRAPLEERPNFQAWARDFRYLAAQNLCRWQGYTRIAVGHNKDDRVETFLYRLLTYSGRRSLVVMPPRRGRVIRPLLFMSSREVRDFCRDAEIAWREDESNQSLEYARNQIRHLVTPRLEEIRPDFRERISDTLSLLEDEDEVLDTITDEAWQRTASTEGAETTLDAGEISLLPRAVARLVLRRWLSGHAGPHRQLRLSRRLLDSLVDLCSDTNGSSSISLADDLQVERKYDRLLLAAAGAVTEAGAGAEAPEPVILPVPGNIEYGDYHIEAEELTRQDISDQELTAQGPFNAFIDGQALAPPLVVRAWRSGDRFSPLGLMGTKSIQDLFTDEKIPASDRGGVPIVTCGNDIVWVCGIRISEDYKVTTESDRLVRLKAARRQFDNGIR